VHCHGEIYCRNVHRRRVGGDADGAWRALILSRNCSHLD
jgi:hypothetical protein